MNDEALIRVKNVGKKFCRSLKKSLIYGVQDVGCDLAGIDRSGKDLRHQEFWANEGISFELKRGECLGLIGKNGAGKTTLLKMLNGLIKPDAGKIEMRGRVGALIALGAGFNPILTGRENIYINASVLGLKKSEIHDRLDEIIDFSDLKDFIDTPVQNYSSGMQVRLGFAVATAMNPDVLLVDEVLAVGDSAFKVRCYNRIRDILPETAVVIVSHSMIDIARTCGKVLVLKQGREIYQGSVEKGVQVYNQLNMNEDSSEDEELVIHKDSWVSEVKNISLDTQEDGLNTTCKLKFSFVTTKSLGNCRLRTVFFDESQQPVGEWDSLYYNRVYPVTEGENQISESIFPVRLRSGRYRMAVVLTDQDNRGYHVGIEYGLKVEIENQAAAGAAYKV